MGLFMKANQKPPEHLKSLLATSLFTSKANENMLEVTLLVIFKLKSIFMVGEVDHDLGLETFCKLPKSK